MGFRPRIRQGDELGDIAPIRWDSPNNVEAKYSTCSGSSLASSKASAIRDIAPHRRMLLRRAPVPNEQKIRPHDETAGDETTAGCTRKNYTT